MAGVWVLCAVLVLLGIGAALKVVQGRWLAPGPLFAFYWAVCLTLPPLLAPQFRISAPAVWYIVGLVTAFCFGSWVAVWREPTRPEGMRPRPLNFRGLRWTVAAGSLAGVLAAVVMQVTSGQSIASLLSLSALFESASTLAEARYTDAIATPPAVPLLLAFNYASALVASFAAEGLRGWRAVGCYLGPFLGATTFASVTTARAGMITAAAFLFAGWVAAHIRRTGETPAVRARTAATIGGVAALVVIAFVGIAFLRVGSFTERFQDLVFEKMGIYAVGYMPGFSVWFDESAEAGPSAWGAASFAGVAKYIGGDERFGSALLDFVPLGDGRSSNIFTAWRYLIEDFGWIGALPVIVVLGYVVTRAWAALIDRPTTAALVTVLCGYAYLLHSNTLPIFTFTNVVAAVAIAALALSRRPPSLKTEPELSYVIAARRARDLAELSSRRG